MQTDRQNARKISALLSAATLLVGLALCTIGFHTALSTPAAAQALKRTDPGHMQGAPRGTYKSPRPYPSPRFHKPHQNPFAAGVIWIADGAFSERAKSNGPLSQACREGRFGRVAGGYADFDDVRVTAAPPRGLVNRSGITLLFPIYFFRYENSTNCQVYVPQ